LFTYFEKAFRAVFQAWHDANKAFAAGEITPNGDGDPMLFEVIRPMWEANRICSLSSTLI
jgi:hypothetical protein